jgi:beta-lactamase regulating signal transducer with metallopeptidase domain
MIAELMTHLWQSTLFAVAAGFLTLAFRKNRAKVRFWLWLSASLKFFIPFALLMNPGTHVKWTPAAHQIAAQIATPAVSFAVEYVAQPFPETFTLPSSAARASRGIDWTLFAILGAWACGFFVIAVIRLRLWRRIRSAVRVSTLLKIPTTVEARVAPGLLEPGVVGLLKPVLLLPEGILDRLTESQLEAVLAHELCHVRRRDNLFAAIHMIVEAVFWFHPLVWWIGARLVEERERACDEDVLSLGNQPRIYADAILNVCRLYVESPLVCVSGVTGSDIKRRIEAIMTNRGIQTLNRAKKVLLATAGCIAVAGPVLVGVVIGIGHVPAIHAQSPVAAFSAAQVGIPAFAQAAQTAAVAQSPAVQTTTPSLATSTTPQAPPLLYKDRRLVVMLFDFSNMSSDDQGRLRNTAVDFVHTQLKPADVVSVLVGHAGGVEVLQDFTDNQDVLEKAVGQAGTTDGAGTASTMDSKLAIISTAAKMLGVFPAKKALMYFSSGITQSGMDNQASLKSAMTAATMANVAIYPIDARGTTEAITRYKKWMDDEVRYVISDEERKAQASGPIGGIVGGAPATAVPGGRGPGPAVSTPPAGVSPDEYNQRVAYAQSTFGSATSAMSRAYIRYGAPDQIDTPKAGDSQIWRYNYLEDFHGGAAFEFATSSPLAARIVYPPATATYTGRPGTTAQFASLVDALAREPQKTGKTAEPSVIEGLPGRHTSLQVYPTAPGVAAAADRRYVPFSVPLDSLSGQVDIAGQVRMQSATGGDGRMMAAIRDYVQASVGTFSSGFTLAPGSYVLHVLAGERASGKIYVENIDFDVQ